MTGNIDAILERLAEDELAHALIALLQDTPREEWQSILESELTRRRDEMVAGDGTGETPAA